MDQHETKNGHKNIRSMGIGSIIAKNSYKMRYILYDFFFTFLKY